MTQSTGPVRTSPNDFEMIKRKAVCCHSRRPEVKNERNLNALRRKKVLIKNKSNNSFFFFVHCHCKRIVHIVFLDMPSNHDECFVASPSSNTHSNPNNSHDQFIVLLTGVFFCCRQSSPLRTASPPRSFLDPTSQTRKTGKNDTTSAWMAADTDVCSSCLQAKKHPIA